MSEIISTEQFPDNYGDEITFVRYNDGSWSRYRPAEPGFVDYKGQCAEGNISSLKITDIYLATEIIPKKLQASCEN